MLRFQTFATPLGAFTVLASDDGVVATTTGPVADLIGGLPEAAGPGRLPAVGAEVSAFFRGRLRSFQTPVDLRLVTTPFARRVLQITATIPYGQMWTYGDVAAMAGRPGAARAAGSALARSPIEVFVPCHRVVPAGAGFGRYGGEDDRRLTLLRLEGAV